METEKYTGHLILIVSVPGAGKSTLINHLRETHPDFAYAVSCTSRPMRPGEIEGRNYHFVTEEEFKRRIDNDEFLEWTQFDGGRYYGTLKSEILDKMKEGTIVVREVEINGAKNIRNIVSSDDLTVVFIRAGSWEEMAERMIARAPISDEELEHRRERYESELPFGETADYVITNRNGELDAAKQQIVDIAEEIIENVKNKK